jgi:hypothetical protein
VTAIELDVIKRFYAKVAPPTRSGCRLWTGAKTRGGYGNFGWMGGNIDAHRFACILRWGPPPVPGMHAAHGCRNRHCVEHVTWKTPKQNEADKLRDGTRARGSAVPQAKLTESDVAEIRAELRRGVTQQTLADRYGVGQVTISHIKNRITWKHVTDVTDSNNNA